MLIALVNEAHVSGENQCGLFQVVIAGPGTERAHYRHRLLMLTKLHIA